ncbi:MAG: hypothetical protein R3185_08425, partial [Candidatus Thermoplasmatota archaeon]|nr:hypothetical protein [Candidatus Thermoplasmatota archaeon]
MGAPGRRSPKHAGTDRTVAVIGALAILLAGLSLVVVEARAGPFEHAITQPGPTASLTGTYTYEPGQDPLGTGAVCQQAGQPGCSPPQVEVELPVEGLPRVDPPAAYGVFLLDATGDMLALGTLSQEEGAGTFRASQQAGDARFTALGLILVDGQA